MKYKTTKKDFELFKKECEKWIEYFGLKEWECHFDHAPCIKGSNRAEIAHNVYGKIATFTLNTEINSKSGNKMIPFTGKGTFRVSGFHEVCELLMAPLYNLAAYSFNEEEVQKDCHSIIRRLENTVFKDSL